MPKKVSVSYGWRQTSRATLAEVRVGLAMAACRASSAAMACVVRPAVKEVTNAAARINRFMVWVSPNRAARAARAADDRGWHRARQPDCDRSRKPSVTLAVFAHQEP